MKWFTRLIIWIIVVWVWFPIGINIYDNWYKETHWKRTHVRCDIWVWDAFKGLVVAEDDERIYISGQRQCLMYCWGSPYEDEEMKNLLTEMGVTEEYLQWYPDDDVKYKSECYREEQGLMYNDKMKAIIERYGWDKWE